MNLRYALLLSLGLHLGASGVIGLYLGSLAVPADIRAMDGRDLVFNLVDPAEYVLAQFAAESASAPVSVVATPSRRPGASEVGTSPAMGGSAGAGESTRRRLSDRPSMQELAETFGLELEGMPDPFADRLFPVMLKYHHQGDRPTASTYRELLRTYIDGHMGYPHAVTEPLRANREIRFLAWIEILVQADGSFQVDAMLMNEKVQDPGGTLSGFYRRLLDEVATRPFLPPADAGLPTPHRLAYQLVNPESR